MGELELIFASVQQLAALAACQSLRFLTLERCNAVSNMSVLAACPNLCSLALSSCEAVSDVSGLAACPSLRTLTIDGCFRVDCGQCVGTVAVIRSVMYQD